MKLTEEQQEQLVCEQEDVLHFQYVDIKELYMDSHGTMVCLCIIQDKDTLKLYGFMYEHTSEELLFDYAHKDLFELESKEVVITEYVRKDGKEITV